MSITYIFEESIYINMTNKCTNTCIFCIRNEFDTVGNSDSLWLDAEPSSEKVLEELLTYDFGSYKEIVFCGFGEPLIRLFDVLWLCKKIKEITTLPIRINTNGHADLIFKEDTAKQFAGLVDSISISLNAANPDEYNRLCKPVFGDDTFYAVIKFAKDCTKYIPNVTLTCVDIISEAEIEACRKIAQEIGATFKARKMID